MMNDENVEQEKQGHTQMMRDCKLVLYFVPVFIYNLQIVSILIIIIPFETTVSF